jgi:hypothetical protein
MEFKLWRIKRQTDRVYDPGQKTVAWPAEFLHKDTYSWVRLEEIRKVVCSLVLAFNSLGATNSYSLSSLYVMFFIEQNVKNIFVGKWSTRTALRHSWSRHFRPHVCLHASLCWSQGTPETGLCRGNFHSL